jgi:hypothetical protein
MNKRDLKGASESKITMPVELNSKKVIEFYSYLFFIKSKLKMGEDVDIDDYKQILDAIYFSEENKTLQYLFSLANYSIVEKTYMNSSNTGFAAIGKFYNLIDKGTLNKLQFTSFDEFFNSKLCRFIYIFYNLYNLFKDLTNETSNASYIVQFVLLPNLRFFQLQNKSNDVNGLDEDYILEVSLVYFDLIQLLFKRKMSDSLLNLNSLSEIQEKDKVFMENNFIEINDLHNKKRIITYIDYKISEIVDMKSYTRNFLNGVLCSMIGLVRTKTEFDDYVQTKLEEANNNIEKVTKINFDYKTHIITEIKTRLLTKENEIKRFHDLLNR